ncbi:DUF6189 family protein [Streptomyces termitum]|uniref:DUF6189 family protein n=1 Tax=Streptomyces termitum TaxID=67368 RepID=UPI00167276C3|nr:DUF6189 family protein [Streptomyces termitum]
MHEFLRRSALAVERLVPRIGPRYREMILTSAQAGAWDVAVPDLVGALSEEDVVITAAEKEELWLLMLHMEAPPTRLAGIRTRGHRRPA